MNAVYRGPADNFIQPGTNKVYHPGDTIPLSKAEKAHLELNGHVFDDTDLDAVALLTAGRGLIRPETAPRGDRGEVLDIPDATTPARAATAPAVPAPSKAD